MILPLLASSLQPVQAAADPSGGSPAAAPMPGHDDTVVFLACFAYEATLSEPPPASPSR